MDYRVPLNKVSRPISKVSTLITDNSSSHVKSSNNILSEELHNPFSIIGLVGMTSAYLET